MYSSIVFWISLLLSLYSLTTGSPLWDADRENEIENRLELENFEARFYSQLEETDPNSPLEVRGDRPGQANEQSRCDVITGVPNDVRSALRLSSFYSKYTHAYNIPVLGSFRVSDRALQRACYVVRFLLADRPDLRQIALTTAVAGFNSRLTNAYNSARRRGLWQNTYADDTVDEYFAEGVQSFFNVESPPVFGIHNDIDTREELAAYDPTLYNLIREAFPCMNNIVDRCQSQGQISSQPLRMNCAGTNTGGTGGRPGNQCEDRNQFCPSWASRGECQRNPAYMLPNCPLSCNQCQE
ncbi:hypothetical protein BSL78_06364 [Apostichopus japonicus]|uniref:ShKT domain-containing protein n=1 Tax=Stichopus japonicus TaxID=307972 RepID=A0A2G8L8Z7_STIJA|nr:hypothetical protein BSL78_06364 [Apostichopus japonicus]